MPEVVKTSETKVQNTCDQLIWWGFRCQSPAEFLVKRQNSTEYAIMCAKHKREFESHFSNEKVDYHDYSLELNQQFADEANLLYGGEK